MKIRTWAVAGVAVITIARVGRSHRLAPGDLPKR